MRGAPSLQLRLTIERGPESWGERDMFNKFASAHTLAASVHADCFHKIFSLSLSLFACSGLLRHLVQWEHYDLSHNGKLLLTTSFFHLIQCSTVEGARCEKEHTTKCAEASSPRWCTGFPFSFWLSANDAYAGEHSRQCISPSIG